MTHGGWKAPSNIDTTEISVIKTEAPDDLSSKSSSKRLPAVLDGMDKAEALAYVCRLLMQFSRRCPLGRCAADQAVHQPVQSHRQQGDTRRLSLRDPRVHALAGSPPSTSASAGDQPRVLSGLGVPPAGTSRGRTHEASDLQPADRCHLKPLPMGIGSKPFSGHWSATKPDAPAPCSMPRRPQGLISEQIGHCSWQPSSEPLTSTATPSAITP